MKKVIVLYKEMDIGGIESSLFHFIKKMKPHANVELVTWMKGARDNEVEVPHEVLVPKLSKNLYVTKKNKVDIKKEPLKTRLTWLYYKLLMKLNIFDKYIFNKFKRDKKVFTADVGVCFAPWELSLRIYENKFKCKYNICLIHGDVRSVDLSNVKKFLFKYDKILCVSNSCAEVFKNKYPELAEKVDYIYNFQDNQKIINGSTAFEVDYNKDKLNIVSVSRLSEEKAHLRTLNVLKRLHDEGYSFIWNIIGDGEKRHEIESFISANDMQNYVKLYGNQKNPYPYIKAADLFFLGSYHEAAPMVFAESMLLGVPVLTTKTCSAEELVGGNGFVCENDEEGIYNSFKELLNDRSLVYEKAKNLVSYKFNNEEIEEKYKGILGI